MISIALHKKPGEIATAELLPILEARIDALISELQQLKEAARVYEQHGHHTRLGKPLTTVGFYLSNLFQPKNPKHAWYSNFIQQSHEKEQKRISTQATN